MSTNTNTALFAAVPALTLPLAHRFLKPGVMLQVLRLGTAVAALDLYDAGRLPLMVTVAALLDGVVVGGTALVAAWLSGSGVWGRRLAALWSRLGLVTLANVVVRVAWTARDYPRDVLVLTQGTLGVALAAALVAAVAVHVAHLRAVRG